MLDSPFLALHKMKAGMMLCFVVRLWKVWLLLTETMTKLLLHWKEYVNGGV
jgi:hypothetical protein